MRYAPYIIAAMVCILHVLGFWLEKYINGSASLPVWLFVSAVDIFFGFKCGHFIRGLSLKVYKDALTDLPNRGFFNIVASEELGKLNGSNNLSLLMIDLDDFKRINDIYGHATGDMVLRETAQIFNSVKRENDIALRWGGEEFVIILPDTNAEGASILGERVRSAVERHVYTSIPTQVTVSIGVATVNTRTDIDYFIKLADVALYQAKALKNAVICALPASIMGKPQVVFAEDNPK